MPEFFYQVRFALMFLRVFPELSKDNLWFVILCFAFIVVNFCIMVSLCLWTLKRSYAAWQLKYYNVTTNLLIFLLYMPLAEACITVWNCEAELMQSVECKSGMWYALLVTSVICLFFLFLQNSCNIIFYNNRNFRSLDFLAISEFQVNIWFFSSVEKLILVFCCVFSY